MTSKRATILLRRFAEVKVDLATEIANPGARLWLYRKLKAWLDGLDEERRAEVVRLLAAGRPLLSRHFAGAPAELAQVGGLSVDLPPTRARVERKAADARRARKARGRLRRREREAG